MIMSPYGFPTNPTKWSVELISNTLYNILNPVSNTWYNLGSLSLSAPIGNWKAKFSIPIFNNRTSAGSVSPFFGFSTNNNSLSPDAFWLRSYAAPVTGLMDTLTGEKLLNLSSKTIYYCIVSTDQVGTSSLQFCPGGNETLKITLLCVYL